MVLAYHEVRTASASAFGVLREAAAFVWIPGLFSPLWYCWEFVRCWDVWVTIPLRECRDLRCLLVWGSWNSNWRTIPLSFQKTLIFFPENCFVALASLVFTISEGWLWIHSNLPASVSPTLGSPTCTTRLSWSRSLVGGTVSVAGNWD